MTISAYFDPQSKKHMIETYTYRHFFNFNILQYPAFLTTFSSLTNTSLLLSYTKDFRKFCNLLLNTKHHHDPIVSFSLTYRSDHFKQL